MTSVQNSYEIPNSWSELAKQLGVSQPLVSRAVRTLLSTREGGAPNESPSPKIAGRAFVDQVINALGKSANPVGRPPKDRSAPSKTETQRVIRECLDKHEKLLGGNLIETVADELGLSLEVVREALRQRWEALKLEKKILAEMEAAQTAEKNRRSAHEAQRARAAQEEAERARPRPNAPPVTTLLPAEPSTPPRGEKTPPTDPRASRPDTIPERGVNIAVDETLRAAWISLRAGLPDVVLRTMLALQEDFPDVTEADATKAIEACYWERPEGARKAMEKRAERLKGGE